MEIVIGPEIIRSYKRLSYTPWHALAEFVDNSTQSYFDHRESLDEVYAPESQVLTVQISYNRAASGTLTIVDNAMGMSEKELADALRIGKPPQDTTGRSEFGMGLKTSASWFGNNWTVRTKKLGESEGHLIHFDVEQIASGNPDLHYEDFQESESAHYTIITITDLNQTLTGTKIEQIKSFLRSMYRIDTTSGLLRLSFNSQQLRWISPRDANNIRIHDGDRCYLEIDFEISMKKVHGWIAVLERGSRASAGFAIIRRGRVIMGWPDSWRPQAIFGQFEGSNDLVNQRLVGEIHLDDFKVSHTKDSILWDGVEQDQVETILRDFAAGFIEIARSYRRRGARGQSPSRSVINSAISMFEEEIFSPRFQSLISSNGSVPQNLLETVASPMIQAVKRQNPSIEFRDNGVTLKLFLSIVPTETDPYLGIELEPDNLVNIVINMNHPLTMDLRGSKAVLNHIKSCAYDGLAQWKADNRWQTTSPPVIHAIKDGFLRIGRAIDNEAEQ